MDWWGKYVVGKNYEGLHFKEHGCDWDGVDCYGLVTLVYKEQFDLDLLQYHDKYVDTDDREALAELLCAKNVVKDGWIEIPLTEPPQAYDVVVFRIYNQPLHCGIVIGPGHMIHAMDGQDVTVERFISKTWQPRLASIYRHPHVGAVHC
jgi:cell wall-associated NlpC family hydrolase